MLNEDSIEAIRVSGIFTLVGVLIGSLFPVIKDILTLKNNQKIEYIRLHDKEKVEAYKNLFTFIQNLRITIWPDNEEVYHSFIEDCKNNLNKIIPNYPYYSRKVIEELSKIESLYDMTIIDVTWVIPPEEKVKDELPKIVGKLYKIVLDEFKKWNK